MVIDKVTGEIIENPINQDEIYELRVKLAYHFPAIPASFWINFDIDSKMVHRTSLCRIFLKKAIYRKLSKINEKYNTQYLEKIFKED